MLSIMSFSRLHKTDMLILVIIHRNEVISEMSTLFWDRLTAICEERNQTPSRVCRDIGLSSGNPPAWKAGRVPSMAIIQKIARHFHVQDRYFLDEDYETKKAPAETAGVTEGDLKFALFGDAEISDETYRMVLDFARIAAERERQEKKKKE